MAAAGLTTQHLRAMAAKVRAEVPPDIRQGTQGETRQDEFARWLEWLADGVETGKVA